jgi:hypothetical protein
MVLLRSNFVPDNRESEEIYMKRTLAFLVICALFIAVAPLSAHHSTAMYTGSRTVTGKVLKFEWTNPHAHVYVETKDESGKTANWAFEMGPPRLLERGGWKKNTMKEGDEVIVAGTLAKDGGKHGNARSVTLASTGQKLGAASSEGTNP